jgi:phosphoribosylanthranilate isomerase
MKAIGVATRADLAVAPAYAAVSDRILFDAKPPKQAILPGGNGASFDWQILDGLHLTKPWMLSGGLNPGNVGEAIRIAGAPGVDVSSGVESAPGEKDVSLIAEFIAAARRAAAPPPPNSPLLV